MKEKKNWIPSVNQFIDKVKLEDDFKDLDYEIIIRNIKNYISKINSGEFASHCSQNNEIEDVDNKKKAILNHFIEYLKKLSSCPIKHVLNATGVVLHTNLGRAPMSENAFDFLRKNSLNYLNIEFDLKTGKRAYRDDFLKDIFHFITGSEDVVVVNNNAAALYLILNTLIPSHQNYSTQSSLSYNQFENKNIKNQVIISRGELVEIGGSFRIPDILESSGAVLKEVGTTNCTRLSDYEKAINENTALILKAHTSNYTINGYTESVEIDDLVALSKKYNLPFVYDVGSGLIKKTKSLKYSNELTIPEYISKDIDIICFSGDKLLGSSQAGIILGKGCYLNQFKKNPLMRVLRADKFTISNLYFHISMYKNENELLLNNKVYNILSQSEDELKEKALLLSNSLNKYCIKNKINEVSAFTGGGSMPDLKLKSYEVCLDIETQKTKDEDLYHRLLLLDTPIVTVLRERKLFINIYTIEKEDIEYIAKSINLIIQNSIST
ncbi:MAG: L-seryl-tRNA(Sec) selenium transferase [Candidatus Cloacimonetes bacterium]|nr:L-seryl-tRNA(Sec) selenium transferase [Candidatus Cloacimonadota bacterium]